MPGCVEGDQHAAGNVRVHERADFRWGDHVVGALEHQRRDPDRREVGPVVRKERGPGEGVSDGLCNKILLS
jgi:hypothetical protein